MKMLQQVPCLCSLGRVRSSRHCPHHALCQTHTPARPHHLPMLPCELQACTPIRRVHWPLAGAADSCASPCRLPVASRHAAGQRAGPRQPYNHKPYIAPSLSDNLNTAADCCSYTRDPISTLYPFVSMPLVCHPSLLLQERATARAPSATPRSAVTGDWQVHSGGVRPVFTSGNQPASPAVKLEQSSMSIPTLGWDGAVTIVVLGLGLIAMMADWLAPHLTFTLMVRRKPWIACMCKA